jgi:hypothetical protein
VKQHTRLPGIPPSPRGCARSRTSRHRSSPHRFAHSSSAVVDSLDGVWIPFVTWPIGTSAVAQRGKDRLEDLPALVAMVAAHGIHRGAARMARCAMLNGSSE